MKVLILSTFRKEGGAAIAAQRLMHALNASGVETTMLSRHSLPLPFWKKRWGGIPSVMERLRIWLANGMSRHNLFAIDTACCGEDVTRTAAFKEADVIHLHWINQGFISLKTLRKILRSGKKIVWTMHDQWPLAGICHHSDDCIRHQTECRRCPLLIRGGERDMANRTFLRKRKVYAEGKITFVACSKWLAEKTQKSALSYGHKVLSIPNPIDINLFRPMDKLAARRELGLREDAVLVLFGCQKVTNKMKGLDYLMQAMKELQGIGVVLVGGNSTEVTALLPEDIEVTPLGQVSDMETMAKIYAAVDAFVTPSLQENLPNTIMEAMACGTPCVGFNVGGIPEMIDHHENGYVADFKNAKSLAEGIRYVTTKDNAERLGKNAREKVIRCYGEESVAERYRKLYEEQ